MNLSIWKRIIRSKHGLSLGSCILLQGILMAVAGPILPVVLSDKIGLDKTSVTIYYLLTTIVGIVVTLGTGYLSDGAIARYKLVLVSGIIATLGYVGIAIATQPIHAFIAGPITVALAVLFPQLFAVARAGIVADWERDAQVMGITALRTLFSFGFILGTGLASWLAQIMDIQAIFWIIAVALVALTAYATFVLYHIEGYIAQQARQAAEAADRVPLEAPAISLPLYALIVPLLALVVLRGADSTRGVYLSLVMFQLFHDASLAPLMFGITAAFELLTMGLISYLSSKIGEKTAISIGAGFGAVYFIALSFTQSLPLIYFVHVLYAVFNAALLGVAMAYIQSLIANRAGMGGSLYMAVLSVGSLIGILSPSLVAGYDQKIFIIPAILCVAGAIMLMVGDRTAQIEKRLLAQGMSAPPKTTPADSKT